jgi:4a-hydroxytetrahydrobiopterin dehydratase
MPWAQLLSEPEIGEGLAALPEWRREGDALVRTIVLPTFLESIALVNRVADAAELANHHPDITIIWKRVTFNLTTKASKGLTWRDLDMAATIDRLAVGDESRPSP